MLPDTNRRVTQHTSEQINRRIREQTRKNIVRYANASPAEIQRRLDELDQEWDIERTLEANAATLALGGLVLGATVNRKWFIFPGVIAAFLLQHSLQGWCPPVPVFRRMGIRTSAEINEERYALKAARGDFDRVAQHPETTVSGQEVFAAARQ